MERPLFRQLIGRRSCHTTYPGSAHGWLDSLCQCRLPCPAIVQGYIARASSVSLPDRRASNANSSSEDGSCKTPVEPSPAARAKGLCGQVWTPADGREVTLPPVLRVSDVVNAEPPASLRIARHHPKNGLSPAERPGPLSMQNVTYVLIGSSVCSKCDDHARKDQQCNGSQQAAQQTP